VKHIEDSHQEAVIKWASYVDIDADCPAQYRPIIDFLFAIPNGGKRDGQEAKRLKKLGVTPGIPDLLFSLPLHGYPGLFIEMKRPEGYGKKAGEVTKHQKDKIKDLRMVGYKVVVAYGAGQAIDAITDYLKGKEYHGRT